MAFDPASSDFLRTSELGRKPAPAPSGGPTLADSGEFTAIEHLTKGLAKTEAVVIGIGDDAAAVSINGPTLVSTDILVEGIHFRRDWSSAHQIGRKAAAQNLADIEAMGGVPTALVVAFAAPKQLPLGWAQGLMAGICAEASLVGAAVVGGDLASADQVVIGITALGESEQAPVQRSGAAPGQVVAFAGSLGLAAGGLVVLSRGFGSPRDLVAAHQVPSPPYGQGAAAAASGAAAMIDISDGLLADLGHLASASGVRIELDSSKLPVGPDLQRLAAATGIDPLRLVLTGGEDHALAACFEPDRVPGGWRVIGEVVGGAPEVVVDGEPWEASQGFDHFA